MLQRRQAGATDAPARDQAPAPSRPRSNAPSRAADPAGPSSLNADPGRTRGPFASAWLNDALGACFGQDLSALSATFGDAGQDAISANASTAGRDMTFAPGIAEDGADPAAMETIAHETAHALAGGGSGATLLDEAGDPGEHAAADAGRRFAAWVSGGMQGAAPRLRPASGGRAAIHREASRSLPTVSGSPPLRMGSRGPAVSAVQTLLNAHGARLAVDGDFGRLTHAAVVSFQSSHGLAADGVVGPMTAAALNQRSGGASEGSGAPAASGGAISGSPPLQQGSSGSRVRGLQTRLNALGARLGVDGEFGPATAGAVRSFQRANGLAADGVVGPMTAGKLNDPNARSIGTTPAPGGGGQQDQDLPQGMASAHFSYAEFASRDGAPTPAEYLPNIRALAAELEVLRAELNTALHINSGYRSPSHNANVDGAANSQHLYGKAADISASGYSASQVADAIERLIRAGRMQEGGLGRYSSFVHYDIRGYRARW